MDRDFRQTHEAFSNYVHVISLQIIPCIPAGLSAGRCGRFSEIIEFC